MLDTYLIWFHLILKLVLNRSNAMCIWCNLPRSVRYHLKIYPRAFYSMVCDYWIEIMVNVGNDCVLSGRQLGHEMVLGI